MFRRTFKAILILHSIHLRVQIRLETETDLDYTEAMQYELHFVDTIDSTNNAVKALAQAGASEGFVLIADHQTAGRGRLGRSFYSPSGSGLYLSILLRPEGAIPPASLTCLTAAAAAETAGRSLRQYRFAARRRAKRTRLFQRHSDVCNTLPGTKFREAFHNMQRTGIETISKTHDAAAQ